MEFYALIERHRNRIQKSKQKKTTKTNERQRRRKKNVDHTKKNRSAIVVGIFEGLVLMTSHTDTLEYALTHIKPCAVNTLRLSRTRIFTHSTGILLIYYTFCGS